MSSPYLEPSLSSSDRGEKVGKLPSKISFHDLNGLGHPTSPIKAIRAHCVTCSGDSISEARKCTATSCSLWPYRMGKNPFHGKKKPVTTASGPASNSNSTQANAEDRE